MPAEDRAAIARAAGNGRRIVLRDHIEDLPSVMAAADLVIAMGGYNTSAEILAVGARAVIVPRYWRSGEHGSKGKSGFDAEQLVRAQGLARLGAVEMLDPREFSAAALGAAIERALDRPRLRLSGELRLDGAERVADRLIELAELKQSGGQR